MAKKLFLSLLLGSLSLDVTPLFAANESTPHENITPKNEVCDAPPPNSLLLTSIASGYVNLAWIPSVPGATHRLAVYREVSPGIWILLATYTPVPGNSFAVPGLTAGTYKINAATICTSGESGPNGDDLLFRIIDLMTAGRIPIAPAPIDCGQLINPLDFVWFGFKVQEIGTENLSVFEFTRVGDQGQIRRVGNNPIKAVDDGGNAPIVGQPPIKTKSPILIHDKSKQHPNVGHVALKRGFSPTGVELFGFCNDENPWKPTYQFTVLTAKAIVDSPPPPPQGQGLTQSIVLERFSAKNPFANSLTIFIPESLTASTEATVRIFALNGQLVLIQKLDLHSIQASLITETLLPGMYMLQIESDIETQTLKIVKF